MPAPDDAAFLAEMQARFSATPIHALLGLEIQEPDTSRPATVTVTMPVSPNSFGSTGNVHGGAIATLVDVACATSAARATSFHPGENTLVTADLHVRYVGRPKGRIIRAEATVARAGRTLIVVECRIVDELGTLIAVADFASMIVTLRQPLAPELTTDAHAPEM